MDRLSRFTEIVLAEVLDRTVGKPFFTADIYGDGGAGKRRCIHRLANEGYFSRITINRDGRDMQAYYATPRAWRYADQYGLLAKQEAVQ